MKGVNEEQAASLQTALLHGRRGLSCGPGLVFAYVDQQAFDSNELADTALGWAVASIGEPFLSGFNRGTLARDLHEVGCDLLEDPDDARVAERYGPRGLDALEPLGHSRIAHARVTPRP